MSDLSELQLDAIADEEARVMNEIQIGEHDRELYNYFDAPVIMKIARIFAMSSRKDGNIISVDFELAYSRCANELIEVKRGIKDYAEDRARDRF